MSTATMREATARAESIWRRFVWRLFAVMVVTGSLVLGVGFLVDNAVLTTVGAFFLANAVWMPLWRCHEMTPPTRAEARVSGVAGCSGQQESG